MNKLDITYEVAGNSFEPDDGHSFFKWSNADMQDHIDDCDVGELETHIEEIAQDMAEDFYHNHGGDEYEWPLVFCIKFKGEVIGTPTVEMEMSPTFMASA